MYLWTCAHSKDTDQHEHSCSLIRPDLQVLIRQHIENKTLVLALQDNAPGELMLSSSRWCRHPR